MKCVAPSTALLIAILSAGSADAYQLDGSVFLMAIEDSQFRSVGRARYLDDLNDQVESAILTGTHSVHGPQVFEVAVQATGLYDYTLEGPAVPGACYATTLHAIGEPPAPLPKREKTWSGTTRCAPEDDDLPDKDLPDDGSGDSTTPARRRLAHSARSRW